MVVYRALAMQPKVSQDNVISACFCFSLVHKTVIASSRFPLPCGTGVKSTSETVCVEPVSVEPKMVTGTYGQPVCFNCTTSHLEAHWQVGIGKIC